MKVSNHMPIDMKVTKQALDDFKKIQEYMLLAKKENAFETYAELKDEYLTVKDPAASSGASNLNAPRGGVFDPRGSRQMSASSHLARCSRE